MSASSHAAAGSLAGIRIAVVTVSDRAASGERADATGPVLVEALSALGAIVTASVVSDDQAEITEFIDEAVDNGADAVITTGGTGIGPRDVTPEATAPLIETDLPGIPELLRARDAGRSPLVALSRARADLTAAPARALVVDLPGSPSAVESALEILPELIAHVHAMSKGGDH